MVRALLVLVREAVCSRPVLVSDFLEDKEQAQKKASGSFRVYRQMPVRKHVRREKAE